MQQTRDVYNGRHRRRLWGTARARAPQIIEKISCIFTFYNLLSPNILICLPNIFDKSTPVTEDVSSKLCWAGKYNNLKKHQRTRKLSIIVVVVLLLLIKSPPTIVPPVATANM